MKRRLVQALITGLVVSSLMITPVLATPTSEKLENLKDNVEKLEDEKAAMEAEAQSVNVELSELLLEFNALQLDMENQAKKIDQATKDLVVAEEKEQKQYDDMKLRIKYMYEQGDASVIETLVQAEDFTDLVNKAEYVQEVHTYDREQLAVYVETKNEVKQLKENLEEGQAEMQALSDEMEIQKANLQSTLSQMREEIEDFDAELEKAKDAAEAELKRLQEEAERAEREAREQAEREEAARREEQERQEQNNSNNNSDSSSKEDDEDDEVVSTPPSNASLGQQIANTACQYIGNKYVYGGTSLTNGIDCSGFVQAIHRKYGISTPRTSSAQRSAGKSVKYSEKLPGDVICYSGHVAIYIGNNTIVHASNSAPYPRGGIKTTSPANYRTVLAVRRYW